MNITWLSIWSFTIYLVIFWVFFFICKSWDFICIQIYYFISPVFIKTFLTFSDLHKLVLHSPPTFIMQLKYTLNTRIKQTHRHKKRFSKTNKRKQFSFVSVKFKPFLVPVNTRLKCYIYIYIRYHPRNEILKV